jgi:hypothetical protein
MLEILGLLPCGDRPGMVLGTLLEVPQPTNSSRTGQHQRLASQLDEMSVIFKPLEVDALRVASYTHRLRRFHEQYDGDTQLPFPLHELLLLKKSVTL